MARKDAPSTPPPLRALGGWPDADWFDPSVLSEGEVVGITLPKLPGSRKQSFDLAERSAGGRGARRPGIGQVLEALGASREASFRRPTFFFEAAPALWFAEIPAAKLKVRASDALRGDLIAAAFRGCVLRHEPKRVVAMFWPAADDEITAFVRAAAPPYPLHPQFDEAEDARRLLEPVRRGFLGARRQADEPAPPPDRAAHTRERLAKAERDRLLAELEGLRARVVELQRSQSAVDAMTTLGLDDSRLKSMLRLLHPDRHGNSEAANEAAKWVNGLRDLLKAAAAGT